MIWNLLITEEYKIFKRPLVYICLVLLIAIVLSDLIGQYSVARLNPNNVTTGLSLGSTGESSPRVMRERSNHRMAVQNSTWPAVFILTQEKLRQYSWLTALIIVGSFIGQAYIWRVPQLSFSRGVSRLAYLITWFLAFLLPLLIMVALPMLISASLSALFTQSLLGTFDFRSVRYGQLGLSIFASTYSLLPYLCLALLLAVASRSLIAPIGGGIAFVVLENLLINQRISIAHYLPFSLGEVLTNLSQAIPSVPLASSQNTALHLPNPGELAFASLGLAAWSVVFLLLAAVIFCKQDLPE